jgi:N-acylneuraminate cytidylyltransferase/CMP-N,N'-diacetyllegionaminic acid synthase
MILGIIPARGSSKGIPRKNVKTCYGKPLLLWSIEAAQASIYLDGFVVSTEDIEIANLALWAGANVDIRPEELATDEATTLAVLQYLDKRLKPDIIVLLQPTSPIRLLEKENIIDEAIELFTKSKCDTLATGYRTTHTAWTNNHGPRQSQEPYFHDDGCVYIWKAEVIQAGLWKGKRTCEMEVPSIYNTEIDELADFWRVEGIMRHLYD